jgi:hypothetical protein
MVMAMASVSRFLGAYPVSSMARKAQINTNKGTKNCPDH